MDQPLSGLRVLELATGVAGPYIGKLLADHGADVVKIEPPDGDETRSHGPFPDGPDPERSARFRHLNTNKRGAVADLDTHEGIALVTGLIPTVDAIIESFPPGHLAARGLAVDEMRRLRGDLVVTSVTPFGQTGPYAGLPGADIVTYAMGGPMWGTGTADREPVKLGGEVTSYQCGAIGAVSTLAALMIARGSGTPTHVDLSCFEAQAGSIDRRVAYLLYRQWVGEDCGRSPRQRVSAAPSGFYPTLDGHVLAFTIPTWVPRMLDTLDDAELRARFSDPGWMTDDELPDVVAATLVPWFLDRDRAGASAQAQEQRWAVTPLNAPVDVVHDDHFDERGFWVDVDHPVGGVVRQPGPPFRLDGAWRLRRPAPTLGQHQAEIEAERTPVHAGTEAGETAGAAPRRVSTSPRLPLEGVRVADLTVVWAGPAATMHLADLGADVIRIDNPRHFPTATRGTMPRPPRELVPDLGVLSGYPHGDPGERPWNRHNMFSSHARNKRSCTVDLTTDLGAEMVLRLLEHCDVLIENNTVGVLDRLGLDWDTLHARNPSLIVVRMPPMGLHGPYAHWLGFGASFEALCGLTALRGYHDDEPESLTSVFHMDPASGAGAAFATMCALRRREATGVGELVEFPQSENMMQHIGEYLIDAAATGRRHGPGGNRNPVRVPQGCYPCAGDDEWVVVSVGSDDEWRRLVDLVGAPEWADPTMGRDERAARHDEIDDGLAVWTRDRSSREVFDACREAGVTAGPVMTESELYDDPHLAARGWFRRQGSADQGWWTYPGLQWSWDGPDMRWGPINRLGDANHEIWRDLVGVSDAEWDALVAGHHITDSYLGPDDRPL